MVHEKVLANIGTHFSPDPCNKNRFIAYHVEKCEKCKCEMQSANAINVHESMNRLLHFGMIFNPILLPEAGYDEKTNKVICEGCSSENNKMNDTEAINAIIAVVSQFEDGTFESGLAMGQISKIVTDLQM